MAQLPSMRRPLRVLAVALLACAAPLLAPRAEEVTAADLAFCFQLRPVLLEGVLVGHLCVIPPSDTGADVLDLDPDPPAPGTGDGFGYHVVALPRFVLTDSPAAILISDAYASPYNPVPSAELGLPQDTIRYEQMLIDGLSAGHVVAQPAYRNPDDVNVDVCSPSANPIAALNPNCHVLYRTLILHGEQSCPGVQGACVAVPNFSLGSALDDQNNGFVVRLEQLITYLLAQGLTLPDALVGLDGARLRVAGHGDGSGHTHLIAKQTAIIRRACHLAGPRDFDQVAGDFASWFTSVAAGSLTPLDQLRALVSDQDSQATEITDSYAHLGLLENAQYRVLPDASGADGHTTVFELAAHGDDRMEACFPRICGDLDGSAILDESDVSRYRQVLSDPSLPFTPEEEPRCALSSATSACEILDVVLLRRELAHQGPGLEEPCPAAEVSEESPI